MARDPYVDVKKEVEQNLRATHTLLESYDRLSDTSTSSTFAEAQEELRGTLALLEADLEDLEESVRVVEATGDRWGIEESEVKRRRGFVERVKAEVRDLRGKIHGNGQGNAHSRSKGKGKERGPYRDLPDDLEAGPEDDAEEARRWEMEEQQTLIRQQDDTLGFISGTLTTLASQAGLIGQEVGEQTEMLDDLGSRVDTTTSRLKRVQRQMNDFIRRNEETKSGWCICILIFVLIALLIAVIIT
ncbi:syntaxin 6, N-terminal-domain-containing protein [Kockovaella imperatae]|uniref:Syntaxin 6, N-terminal-domain-containing protein n=1 Tax=Kockovaella imperatae TaxID=4999 RepID=A0A1Y1U8L7_9TREE|nr:syntaxin 6, N-terminal-domain-containing protein [Kockovaella imperatae]ORX34389.1 syntaxin 6, N-terminal-domain-containing protein [Kockovaella imperatae]